MCRVEEGLFILKQSFRAEFVHVCNNVSRRYIACGLGIYI